MFRFVGMPVLSGEIVWQDLSGSFVDSKEGVVISFNFHRRCTRREMIASIARITTANNVDFIRFVGNNLWRIDFDSAKSFFKNQQFADANWVYSSVTCEAEIEVHRSDFDDTETTTLAFPFSKEELFLMLGQKIFLSHKGVNKPIARDIAKILTTLGFVPWLDEDAMQAGANLERELLQGMKQSCAAVFFLTPDYVDENYLTTEIDYAIQEKRIKKDRFAIITIVLADNQGYKGKVPDLLRPYVWKEPLSELQILDAIIKAIPITTSGIVWK